MLDWWGVFWPYPGWETYESAAIVPAIMERVAAVEESLRVVAEQDPLARGLVVEL